MAETTPTFAAPPEYDAAPSPQSTSVPVPETALAPSAAMEPPAAQIAASPSMESVPDRDAPSASVTRQNSPAVMDTSPSIAPARTKSRPTVSAE